MNAIPVPDLRLLPELPPAGADEFPHRLFHGRGGSIPGLEWLTIDRFPPVMVATLFRDPGADAIESLHARLLDELERQGCTALVFQHRHRHPVENVLRAGELPAQPVAVEGGLRYLLDFGRGQNLGFFPDMAPGRARVHELARGRRVLNLFAFTCSFSVAALAGGADAVVNIDLSRPALTLGQRNHTLNGLDAGRAHFLPHDIFRSWKKLHRLGRYGLVVIDPPSDQKGSFVARRDYARLVRQLHRLLLPEADILACLNAPWLPEAFLDAVMHENLPGVERVERLPLAPGFTEPDPDAALKVIHYRYRRPDSLPPIEIVDTP